MSTTPRLPEPDQRVKSCPDCGVRRDAPFFHLKDCPRGRIKADLPGMAKQAREADGEAEYLSWEN